MIAYFIKANIALALLYLALRLVSGRDTLFAARRTGYLSVILFSLLFPLIHLPQLFASGTAGNLASQFSVALDTITVRGAGADIQTVPLVEVLLGIYLSVAVLLLLRLSVQLFSILRIRMRSTPTIFERERVFIPSDGGSPFSFFRWIFADPSKCTEAEFRDIMAHELTHAGQVHSLDVLISELVKILFWFNPFVWMLAADIRRNLEYLADRRAVAEGSDRRKYQYNLLKLTYSESRPGLTNNFNQSQLKKRIVMMNKKRSSGTGLLKYALVLPASMLMLTSLNSFAQQPQNVKEEFPAGYPVEKISSYDVITAEDGSKRLTVYTNDASEETINNEDASLQVEVMPKFRGQGVQSFMNWVMTNVNYPTDAIDEGLEGTVVVNFVIEKDGTLSMMQILRSPGESLSKEVVRVLLNSPQWTPGLHDGQPVRVKFTLPVRFAFS